VDTPRRAPRRPSKRTVAIVAGIVVLLLVAWFLYRRYEPSISLNRVLDWYARYGYWAVFVPVLLETAGLPLPGETSLLFAGVASSTGRIDVFWVIVVGASAAIIGDNIGYAIGRFGGRRLVMKLAHIGGIERSLAWGEEYFERRGGITVFFARWLPGLRIFGAWIAGMVHMKWWKFALWNAAGGIAWTTSIVLLGHFFGKSIHVVERVLGIGGVVALIAIAILGLVLWRRHERGKAHALETQQEPPEVSESS
jgi:membrane protein DedA with SNARE-associated domain